MKFPSFSIGRFAVQGAVFGLSAAVMVVIVSIVYATASWGSLPSVVSGSGLTATAWNDLVTHVNQSVKQASPVITVSGSNVGIGIPNPSERLDLWGGNIKMGYEIVSNDCIGTTVYTCTVFCPTWKIPTGGWCVVDNSIKYVFRTYPNGNWWACHSQGNLENAGSILRAYAICANIR